MNCSFSFPNQFITFVNPHLVLDKDFVIRYDEQSLKDPYFNSDKSNIMNINQREQITLTNSIDKPINLVDEEIKFDNNNKSNDCPESSSQRRKFTPEEDEKLKRIIAIRGTKKWDDIALLMPGRTGRQCRDRFRNYLDPNLTNGPWTDEEDKILIQKVNEYGQHWNKISVFFKGRSNNNIKNRFNTYISKSKHKYGNNDIKIQNNKIDNEIYFISNDNTINDSHLGTNKKIKPVFPQINYPKSDSVLRLKNTRFNFLKLILQ